jgi:hypothetical protein
LVIGSRSESRIDAQIAQVAHCRWRSLRARSFAPARVSRQRLVCRHRQQKPQRAFSTLVWRDGCALPQRLSRFPAAWSALSRKSLGDRKRPHLEPIHIPEKFVYDVAIHLSRTCDRSKRLGSRGIRLFWIANRHSPPAEPVRVAPASASRSGPIHA